MADRRERSPASAPQRWLDGPEVTSADGPSPEARRLLVRARPYRVPVGRRQRVWRALEEDGARDRRRSGRRGRVLALAAVLVLGGVVTARAHWVGALIADAYRALFVSSHETPMPSTPAGPAEPPASPRELVAPPASPPALSSSSSSASASAPAEGSGGVSAARFHPRRARQAVDEMGPVLEAARALRVAHDPGRARALLAPYLARDSRGPFAEEALALSIEAAAQAGDPDASKLAARYLARYPAGPFRETARRVQAGDSALGP